jgi:hypothetical protein
MARAHGSPARSTVSPGSAATSKACWSSAAGAPPSSEAISFLPLASRANDDGLPSSAHWNASAGGLAAWRRRSTPPHLAGAATPTLEIVYDL